MNTEAKHERIRLIYQRRIRQLVAEHKMQSLNMRQLVDLSGRLVRIKGEGVTDADLRAIIRLTTRGLFTDADENT